MRKVLPLLFLLPCFFFCDVNTGLEPTQSGISGTVYFENDWPAQTDQVMVVASTVFPPTALQDIIMSEPLDTFVDSARYVIWTNPQQFAAIGVVWKEKDQPWDVTNIIGIYFPTADHFSPGRVTIPNRKTLVDSIDIQADLSLARRKVDSGLEGTLTVNGDWPDGAQSVLMVASRTILPTSLLEITFGAPIDAGFDTTTYSLTVLPDTYRLIGALVVEQDSPISFDSIKGMYKKRPGDLFPAPITVPDDTSRIAGVDIVIDFESSLFP